MAYHEVVAAESALCLSHRLTGRLALCSALARPHQAVATLPSSASLKPGDGLNVTAGMVSTGIIDSTKCRRVMLPHGGEG